jgi:hypothetical protein
MDVEAARQALFGDSLVCDDARPAAITATRPDEPRRRAMLLRAEALMRALALVDDSRAEENDERAQADAAIHRLEAKVDLLLGLVAGLLQRDQPGDPVRLMRWSARGVVIDLPTAEAGTHVPDGRALLRLQPSDALPESLQLPVKVLAVEPSPSGRRLWLRFEGMTPALEGLLERHLFRMHRRAIAESRRLR